MDETKDRYTSITFEATTTSLRKGVSISSVGGNHETEAVMIEMNE